MSAMAKVLDRAVAQHGVVSREQLLQLDLTRHQITSLARQGLLLRVGPTTWRVAGGALTPRQRIVAACLETGGVASHQTAAALQGLGGWVLGGRPTILVVRDRGRFRSTLAEVRTTTWLPREDIVRVDGVPATSVARTLVNLAAPKFNLSHEALLDLVDVAVRDGRATDAWLWWRLERLRRRGRPGTRAMERVLAERGAIGLTESWLERAFLELLVRHGLPLPQCQRRIERCGTFVGRVDFAYPGTRILVEVSGHTYHSSRQALAADAARRNELQLAGYRVLEFTYDDVVIRPGAVVAVLRTALGAAA
jgi:very-short-patch-repair endonuclease